MAVSVLYLFLTGPWLGLQCLIVVFPDHTLIRFNFGPFIPLHIRYYDSGNCNICINLKL